jgi:hypothetical protein
MRVKLMAGLILIVAAGLSATDKFQPLNVKLGLWEVTSTTTTNGQSPVPPELLAKLTPEQRARLEERMKAKSADKTSTITYKTCVTKEKLDKSTAFGEDKNNCARTVITSNGSKMDVKLECTGGDLKTTGILELEAVSSESVKGSGHMNISGSDRTMNATANYIGKWIGPACGDIK